MDQDKLARYTKCIVAVGTGQPSTYQKEDIDVCKEIIKLLRNNDTTRAKSKISDLLGKLNVTHTDPDIDSIIQKIQLLKI